jgi:hypothetical protein
LALAVIELADANFLGWRYLMNFTRHEDPYRVDGAALHNRASDEELFAQGKWAYRVSEGAATLSLLGAINLVWLRRKASSHERLPSALLALVALGVFLVVVVI